MKHSIKKALQHTSLAALISAGCTVPHVPYTENQKRWLMSGLLAHSMDMVSTEVGLRSGFQEGNPLFAGADHVGPTMILSTAAAMGVIYLLGECDPQHRELLWKITGMEGYCAATYNAELMQPSGRTRLWE